MAELAQKIDIEALVSFADDLVAVLNNKKDISCLERILEGVNKLRSSCQNDFSEVQTLLVDFQEKVRTYEEKLAEVKKDMNGDAKLDCLRNELEKELQREQLLHQELRLVSEQISDLEHQRVLVEDRKEIQKKVKKEELRARNELSMYASVTKIIPSLDDKERICGHTVERDRRIVEKFEFDPTKTSSVEICNSLWKMGGGL